MSRGIYYPPPPPFIGGQQPLDKGRKLVQPFIPDNPPFGQFARNQPAEYMTCVLAWQPGPPLPQWNRKLVQPYFPDNPPFGHLPRVQPGEYFSIMAAWTPGPPLPQWNLKIVQPGVAAQVDNPPFRQLDLSYVIRQWQPGPPLPTLGEKLLQPFFPDNPPTRQLDLSYIIIRQWQPGPPLPTLGEKLVQSGVAPQVDDPPFAQRHPLGELVAWQPALLLPQRPAIIAPLIGQVVTPDNPPFGQRLWLATIVRLWQPIPQLFIARYFPQPFFPDNPPFGFRCHDGLLGRRDWWNPPFPTQRQRKGDPPPPPLFPPPSGGFIWIDSERAQDFETEGHARNFTSTSRGRVFTVPKQGTES